MSNCCETIMVTSFKGGVGKSTITANLALSMALTGKRVLALDCDFGMRCLDLIMGLESYVVYDICDVCFGNVPLSKAVISDKRSENLFFCPAPYTSDASEIVIEPEKLAEVLTRASEEYNLDYIFIDTPGDNSPILKTVCKCSDKALIVSTHAPSSIRAAERTGASLASMGVKERRLIINNFDLEAVRRNKRAGVIDIIDRTYIQLIGVIPYSKELSELQESGSLIDTIKNTNSYFAFRNITERLSGRAVPLFRDFSLGYEKAKLK